MPIVIQQPRHDTIATGCPYAKLRHQEKARRQMGILGSLREWYQTRHLYSQIKTDPWLYAVLDFGNKILNDPEYVDANPITGYLQKDASKKLREEWATALSQQILPIAASADRIIATREWIFRICEQYAPCRVLMLSGSEATRGAAGGMYHPCISGMYDYLDDLLQKDDELQEIYKREGGLAEAREFVRIHSLSKNLELRIADFARRKLDDFPGAEGDWFIPLLNSMCALIESGYRDTLGLPQLCDHLAILEEQVTLQNNVLKGYRYPLDGVPFACPRKRD